MKRVLFGLFLFPGIPVLLVINYLLSYWAGNSIGGEGGFYLGFFGFFALSTCEALGIGTAMNWEL